MTMPSPETIERERDKLYLLDSDTQITLKDACEIFFKGRIKVATLKAEHARGNLDMSKIGRSYFTTIGKLKEMEERCRVEAPAQSSGSTKRAIRGPSSMDESAAAQASALRKLQERKKHLGITSRRSTR
jgi:hypothetical protein